MSAVSLKARKDLLKVRAALERVELADNAMMVREAASPAAIARSLLGGFGGQGSGGGGAYGGAPRGGLMGALLGGIGGLRSMGVLVPGSLAASAPTLLLQVFRLFRRSPVKASVVGYAGLKFAKAGVKLGALGYLAYHGVKLWRYVNDRPSARIRRVNRQVPPDVGYEAAGVPPPTRSGQTSAYP